jgi:hypothetical protein
LFVHDPSEVESDCPSVVCPAIEGGVEFEGGGGAATAEV